MTGNGVIHVVDRIITQKRHLRPAEIQSAMDAFIDSQVLLPDAWKPIDASEIVGTSPKAKLLRSMLAELEECKETV